MLSLRVALRRVAQDWIGDTAGELCERCGRLAATRKCHEGAVCVICAAGERTRAWRKRRAGVAHLRRASVALLVLVVLSTGRVAAAGAAENVHVHDGDTLTIDHERWRLWGIDAPELDQRCFGAYGHVTACGDLSRAGLIALIGHATPRCAWLGRSFDRAVGRCYVGAIDLGDAMVRSGLAVEYQRYSRGEYRAVELEARGAQRGLWAGSFVMPWDWRKQLRARKDGRD